MADHNELGIKGEELAEKYLRNSGYEILERNWRFGKDEIDIIARDGDFLVIAEVKTRRTNYFGEPEEFVSRIKQRFLIRGANAYIEKMDIDLETRFDILSVLFAGKTYTVKQIKDAFYPLV
ncbi:MAG: endonuclease [Bacteroidetes bacterium 4484_276]|nr:MAG: endonuclease [Bacteroidetes bacterium 4484_276]OYT12897.1 MAG: endonuclease [Bacteroidetes bacterium 4572_114]